MSDRQAGSGRIGRRTAMKGIGAAAVGAIGMGLGPGSAAAKQEGKVTLFAGQDEPVGVVRVNEGAEGLRVSYKTENGWRLTETHLHVGDKFSDIPTNKPGNPIPGRFKHKGKPEQGTTTSVTYRVSTDGKTKPYYIGAHAVVEHDEHGRETAWGDGRKFTDHESARVRGRGSWATYFTYPLGSEGGSE